MSLIKKIYKILFLQNKIILLIFLIMLFDQFMKYFSYMGILLPQHYFIGIGTLYIKSPPFLNPETFIVHQNSVQEWVQIILLIIYPTIMISLLYLIFLIREYYYRVAISAIFLGVTSNYLDRLYTLNTTTIDWLSINNYVFFNIGDLLIIFGLFLIIFCYIITYISKIYKNG